MKITSHTHYLSPALIIIFTISSAFAGSAIWSTSPANGNWNSAPNWTPATVPNGSSDIATFGPSSVRNISLSADTEVNGIVFNPGASAFTITVRPHVVSDFNQILTIGGAGIINNSAVTQNFVTARLGVTGFDGRILFTDSASAGNRTVFTNNGDSVTSFGATSNGGSATFNNNPGDGAHGGATGFGDNSSAGNATINIYGATNALSTGGQVGFSGAATAADATINVYGSSTQFFFEPAKLTFEDSSTAGNAALIAYGGSNGAPGGFIQFVDNSDPGTARIELLGNSHLFAEGKTIGSLEGSGSVGLESSNLTVGSNNLSTVFSGFMDDNSRFGLPPGSFTKIGTGTLVLSGASTYTGGTIVNGGVLQVDNTSGSGTATGPVTVNNGSKLSGTGTIAGNVLNRGVVSPGDSPGTLHLGGNFTQGSDGTLEIEIASLLSFDQLMVAGTARLGGTLDVILDGYTGHAGDIFTILTSSGLIGDFGTFDLPTLDNGLFFTESRTANNVLLTVNGPANLPDQGSTSVLMAGALAALLGLQFLWLGRNEKPSARRIV